MLANSLLATSFVCTQKKINLFSRTYVDFLLFSSIQFIFLVVHLSYVTRLNHDLHFQFLIVPKILKQSKIDLRMTFYKKPPGTFVEVHADYHDLLSVSPDMEV